MMSVIQRTHAPYYSSNQAIKVAINIQGCEQGVIEEEDIYKKRGPPNPYQKYKRFRHFCFSNRKRGSSVVRHLPLVLEIPGSIPAHGEKNFGVQTRFP